MAYTTMTGLRSSAVRVLGGLLAAGALALNTAAQVPVSAEFLDKAPDPRGGDAGYNTFNRLPDGRGVTFGGFSHDRLGRNSVAVYDPVTDVWQIVIPHTPWVDAPVPPNLTVPPYEGRGLTFLGNRDDHVSFVVDNDYWVLDGQRGVNVIGNYRGVLNTQTWQWSIEDDRDLFGPTGALFVPFMSFPLVAAAGWIPSLDIGYVFGGLWAGNPSDALVRLERNPPGSNPAFSYTRIWNSGDDCPSFPGAERLSYVSNQSWVRGSVVHIYGGFREVRQIDPYCAPLGRVASSTLWELKVTDPPQLSIVSTNTLPDGQRVQGGALLGYYDAARDLAVITNGDLVNVYDYATATWSNIPVLTPPDVDRLSPFLGAGRAGFYAPAIDQFIILGGHTRTYGLKLNFSGTTVPSAPPNVVATAGNASATVTFAPPLTDGGSPITSYTVTANPPGGVDQQAGTTATTRMISSLVNGTSYTFSVTATNAVGTGPASSPSNAVTPATVPGAPTGLVATAGNAGATVTFNAPASDGGSPITSYTVTSSPPGGIDQQAGTTATTRTITGLANGTSYTFTATATNAIGSGPPSTPSNAVVPSAPLTVPGAPTMVAATAGNGSASVVFVPPASNGGSPILGYTVASNPPGGVDVHGDLPSLTHLVGNLVNGIGYTFTVTARNAIGVGPASAASNTVTPQAGATCAGFTDVPGDSVLCPSIEWLRNRAIIISCLPSQYCPDQVMSRLSVAAFLQRTGAALTPLLQQLEAQPGALDVAGQPVVCTSGALAGASFGRAAQIRFGVSGMPSGTTTFAALPVISIDDGASWLSPVQLASRVGGIAGQHAQVHGYAVIPMAPDTTYRFALQLFPVAGETALADVRCRLTLEVVPQNAAFTPFDADAAQRGPDGDLH